MKFKPTLICLLIVSLFLMLVNVALSSQLAESGSKLTELSQEKNKLLADINQINTATFASLALTDLKVIANQAGFTPKVVYLHLKSPVAMARLDHVSP